MNCPYCSDPLDIAQAVEINKQLWLEHHCPEKGPTKFIVGRRPLKGV
jgi:uncharacterized radical SAM superfamily Fe-S cluster-containing enzyme